MIIKPYLCCPRLIYSRLVVHTACLKSDIDPSIDSWNMTYTMSLEVTREPNVQNIIPSMVNSNLQVASCVSGALILCVTVSTAFLMVKGGMMSFPPCSLIGQRHLKWWFMTLCAPSSHIAWHASPISLLTHYLSLTHFTLKVIPSVHPLPFFQHMPMWIHVLHISIPVLLNVEMAGWIVFTNLSATCCRIVWLFTRRFFSPFGIDYKYKKWKGLTPNYLFCRLCLKFYAVIVFIKIFCGQKWFTETNIFL